jgi:hypothetical protein
LRGRGRGKGGELKCYACVKIGHMSWECPETKNVGTREAHISEARQKNVETKMKEEAAKEGRSFMMRKIIVNPEKEERELVQRNNLFRTASKTRDRVCKVIIDSGSNDNLVSTEMVEKLKLETTAHPNPYKVSWL